MACGGRLRQNGSVRIDSRPVPHAAADDGPALGFHTLGAQLLDASPEVRRGAALLVAALRPADAAPALVRAYARYGDDVLRDAARAYGPQLTAAAARAALDHSLGASQRCRLLELLGGTGDVFAVRLLREAAKDLDPLVRIAAAVALLALGERDAAEGVEAALLSPRPEHRAAALRLLRRLELPAARALEQAHLERFIADGGAVPSDITVGLPLLLDAGADLVDHLARLAEASAETLLLLSGPATGPLADHRREAFARRLADRTLLFTTDRHSVAEQAEQLARACAAAAAAAPHGRQVVVVGPLPDPADVWPGLTLFTTPSRARFEARLVLAGPQRIAPVLRWWGYLRTTSPVATRLHVVLTDLVLGSERLGPEALAVYEAWQARAGGVRDDALARALLAGLVA